MQTMETEENTENPPVHCWDVWVVYLRVFLANLEILFEKYGKFVAKNPWKVLGICIVSVTFCLLGFMNLQTETRADRLFVPENSPSERALRAGRPYFQNLFNTREEEVIFVPKNDSSVINEGCLQEVIEVTNRVMKSKNYDKVCLPKPAFLKNAPVYDKKIKCAVLSPAEIFKRIGPNRYSISRQLARANRDVVRLMSNGRAPIFNLQMMFSEFKFSMTNESRPRVLATARGIRIIFYVQEREDREFQKMALEWEQHFLKDMASLKSSMKCADLYFTAGRSLDDAIRESSSSDIILISVTFTIMISFACSMMGKYTNPVRGHALLSLAGVFSTALGIAAGLGLAAAFRVPFISLVGVMPFLVLSIGIDDMFIIVDDFDRTSRKQAPSSRVADSMSRVGATITMTTLTDVAAFIVSVQTSFPAIRYFCIYAAACITLEFILQVSFFIALLAFDARRINSSRMDCFPVMRAEDKNKCRIPDTWSFSEKIMRFYTKKILSRPGKATVLILLTVFLAGGIYGSIHVNKEFDRKALAKKGSHYYQFIDKFEALFPLTIPVNLQVTQGLNYSDPVVQKQLTASPKLAFDTGYYLPLNFSWFHFYKKWADTSQLNTTGPYFNNSVNRFLDHPLFKQHNVDVIRDKSGNIIASRILVFMKDSKSSNFHRDAMLTLRNTLSNKFSIPIVSVADPFIFFEQYASVVKEVTKNLIAASLVILFFITPFCVHPLLILMVVFGFVSLIVNLFGLMYFWGVALDAVSMINLVMSIGFAVDYSAHIAHAFITSKEQEVNMKIEDAFVRVGGSVMLGGLSTFLGMLTTAFATSQIFITFFKMFLGIVLFGLFNGMCVLPVLLSLFGHWMHTSVNTSTSYIVSAARDYWERLANRSKREKEEEKKKRVMSIMKDDAKQISVTGISARFPTAKNKEEFWDLLVEGKDTITDYPKNREARFRYFEDYFNPTRPVPGRLYVSKGSYMEDIELFDYKFFGISATEAKSMDPQQRLLLQGTYEAMEDAGVKLDDLQRCTTGVYVGIMNLDYSSVVLRDDVMLTIDQFASTGTAFSIAANRISFSLNLTGPSIAIDTACSSSFSALSMACDHLRDGKCDVALVCAANLILCPKKQVTICRANMLSPDGKCKVFADEADGYGRGEGCLALVLKRRDHAIDSNDQIYGDIISWGINNDGQTAAPMTAPSEEGQKILLVDILNNAGVSPADVQYVEMHGTGTIIGDMVESKSVGEIYGKQRLSNNPLRVGSVKSNINHTESAAGLAGLAKVCLMLDKKVLTATVNVKNQNPRLTLSERNILVQDRYEPWPENKDGLPRLASVNSFGYGGSNAHFVVKEFIPLEPPKTSTDVKSLTDLKRVFVLSARCRSSLVETSRRFSTWMDTLDHTDQTITDVLHSTSARRTEHSHRIAVSFNNLEELSSLLSDLDDNLDNGEKRICFGQTTTSADKIGFVFGGQGSQWRGMGADLLQDSMIKSVIIKIDSLARSNGHKESILDYLTSTEEEEEDEEDESLVTTQLAIFGIEYAISEVLQKRVGVHPLGMVGHSLGDITAACASGRITLKEAVLIIMARAGLQSKCQSNGAMGAAGVSIEEAKELLASLNLEDQLTIAAQNDKANVTFSGDEEAIDELAKHFTENMSKVFWRKLKVDKAFHSHHMESIKEKFFRKLAKANIRPKPGQVKMISSVDGQAIPHTSMDTDYWWRNLRNSVLFYQCTKALLEEGCTLLLEISPRPVLSHYMNNIIKQTGFDNSEDEVLVLQALPRIKEEARYNHFLVHCIGKLYTLGYPVDWNTFMSLQNGKFIRYPPYAWNESRLWSFDIYATYERTMTLLGKPIKVKSEEKAWQNEIDTHNIGFLADHTMKATGCILPGAAYLEMAFEAALEKSSLEPVIVKDLTFYNILPLPKQVIRLVRTTTRRESGSTFEHMEISNLTETNQVRLASASFKAVPRTTKGKTLTLEEAVRLGESCTENDRSSQASLEVSNDSSSDSGISPDNNSAHDTGRDSSARKELIDDCLGGKKLAEKPGKNQNGDSVLQKLKKSFDDVLTREDFNKLAAETGFDFGESFRLIEQAWCNDDSALVKIKLSEEVRNTLGEYVIHPSIIDATLQACIAIKSADKSKPVIPIGIEKVRLCTPKGPIRSLYGYSEVNKSVPDACDLKLLDDKGNVLLYVYAFKVKDLRRAHRYPTYDDSAYKIDWIQRELTSPKKSVEKRKWLLLGVGKSKQMSFLLKALSMANVPDDSIFELDLRDSEGVGKFEEDLRVKLEELDNEDHEIVVVNTLPCLAQTIDCNVSQAMSAQWLSFETTLQTIQTVVKMPEQNYKLLVLTSGSQGYQVLTNNHDNCVPWSSSVWGLVRVTNLEQGRLPTVCVDVSPDPSATDIEKVISYFDSPDAFEGFAVYDGITYVPQYKRVKGVEDPVRPPQSVASSNDLYVSWVHEQQAFALKEWIRVPNMEKDDIEILIHDLSSAVGEILPLLQNAKETRAVNAPYCFCGTVIRVGSEVKEYVAGQEVFGVNHSRWIQNVIRTKASDIAPKDKDMPSGQLVALALCYAEAYQLISKIKTSIEDGGKILIVAAPKHLGFHYAVALLAKATGYEVTLDSRLEERFNENIAVDHLDLQKVYREALKPQSSLMNQFDCLIYPADSHLLDTEAYQSIVKDNGCLVAIHLRDDSDSKGIRLDKQLTLFNISLDKKHYLCPSKMLGYWHSCVSLLKETGNLEMMTKIPYLQLPVPSITEPKLESKFLDAWKLLYSSLSFKDIFEKEVLVIRPSLDTQGCKKNRTYVVIGGSKGLGLDTVRWLASRGAGTVLTVSRSDLDEEVTKEFVEMQQKLGCQVRHVKGDVAQPSGIAALEKELDDSSPLAGIINSAVILDDKIFTDVDRDNYRKVMGPKLCGTIALHNMTEKRGDHLDFFVMYSSITSLLGNIGQSTYSASNAFMNAFADYRQCVLGKPCLSVCWGAMGGTGILERDFKTAAMLESRGLHLLHVREGLKYLERVLTTLPNESCVSLSDIEWSKYLRHQSDKRLNCPFLEEIQKEFSKDEEGEQASLLQMLMATNLIEKQKEILRQFVSRWLAAWIGGSEEEVDMNVPLFTYGIDSVGASAIKAEIEKQLELSFEVFYFMQAETTGNKLTSDLLKAVRDKISGKKNVDEVEEAEEEEEEEDDGELKVPKEFLQKIYKPTGGVANFFCIHPSHRYTGILLPIAQGFKFQKTFNMLTIGSQDPAQKSEDYESVNRLARGYLKLIKKEQAMGPYYLGGYSFGGLLALEIASLLTEQGQDVQLVVMLDTVRWIPKGRNNSQLLLEMYQEDSDPEIHIQAQLLGFMHKIATLQLGIRVEDFEEMAKTQSFDTIVEKMNQRAEEIEKRIPDLQGIYESTALDQSLAGRCHDAWEPSKKLYRGKVLYIHAQDDEFCRAIPGLGSAVDCWKTILQGQVDVVGAPGNHYSMLSPGRAADVGTVIATALLISYRRLYPNFSRTISNSCQQVGLCRLKKGIEVAYYDPKGKAQLCEGAIRITRRLRKFKFVPNSIKEARKTTVAIKSIINLVKLSTGDFPTYLKQKKSYAYLHHDDLYAGISFRLQRGQVANFICHNRQDFMALVNTLREVLSLPLPLANYH